MQMSELYNALMLICLHYFSDHDFKGIWLHQKPMLERSWES